VVQQDLGVHAVRPPGSWSGAGRGAARRSRRAPVGGQGGEGV
jgi:hypothetical protein